MNKKFQRWRPLGRVLLFYIATAVVLATVAPLAPREPGLTHLLSIGAMASLGTFILTLLFVRWEGLRLDDVGAWPDRRSVLRLAFGFLIGLGLVALHTVMAWGVGHVRWVPASGVSFLDATLTLIAFLLLSAREELAFHGYPLRRIYTFSGFWVALLVVAFVFALEHRVGGYTWGQALFGAGIGSLLFSMAAIATRGLALPIGLHAAWNFGDWIRGGKGSGGYWTAVVENGFEEQTRFRGMISYVVVMGLATFAFWRWHRLTEGNHVAQQDA
jgi:membrane protease YdiL (CAAX protease family)